MNLTATSSLRFRYFGTSAGALPGAGAGAGTPPVAVTPPVAGDGSGTSPGLAGTTCSITPFSITPCGTPCLDPKYVSATLVTKNTVARSAVVRDRKLAEPAAPKRLPDDPLPNAAPMSAPFPCCSNTKPQTAIAASTCSTKVADSIRFIRYLPFVEPPSSPTNCQELAGVERCTTHQRTIDIRHRKQRRGV